MKRVFFFSVVVLFAFSGALRAQKDSNQNQKDETTFVAHAFLIDDNVNTTQLADLNLILTPMNGTTGNPISLKTGPQGTVEAALPPGTYHLTTPDPINFQGKKYSWQMDVTIGNVETAVTLSNDNAQVATAAVTRSPGVEICYSSEITVMPALTV